MAADSILNFVIKKSTDGGQNWTTLATLTDQTLTTNTFVVPDLDANVTVQVADTSWMVVDKSVNILGAGFFKIVSIGDSTHVTLKYVSDKLTNTRSGITVASNSQVIPGSYRDPSPLPIGTTEYQVFGNTVQGNQFAENIVTFTSSVNFWSTPFGLTPNFSDGVVSIGAREVSTGDILVAGSFNGTLKFLDGTTLVSTGAQSFFIAKFNSNGNLTWARRFGNTNNTPCTGIEVDNNNNLIVVGNFGGQVDFGGNNVPGDKLTSGETANMYIAKYDASSSTGPTLIWAKTFTGAQNANGITVDVSNNILFTGGYGYYGNSVNFGGGLLPYTPALGSYNVYVAKLDNSGTYVGAKGFTASGLSLGYCIDTSPSGKVAIAGTFQGSITFGGATFTSSGVTDIFVAQFDSTLTHEWSHGFGGTGDDNATGVAIGPNGNVSITGHFQNTVNFGGGDVTTFVTYACYTATYSSTGVWQWNNIIQPLRYGQGNGIDYDSDGNVIIAGASNGLANYGNPNGLFIGGGNFNLFLVKSAPDGTWIWDNVIGGSGNSALSVKVGRFNNLFATGTFQGTLDFGFGVMVSPGSSCSFVAKLPPNH